MLSGKTFRLRDVILAISTLPDGKRLAVTRVKDNGKLNDQRDRVSVIVLKADFSLSAEILYLMSKLDT